MKTIFTTLVLFSSLLLARADFKGNPITTVGTNDMWNVLNGWANTNPVPAANINGAFTTNPTVGPQNMALLKNEPVANALQAQFVQATNSALTNTVNIASLSNSVYLFGLTAPYGPSLNTALLAGNKITNTLGAKTTFWVNYQFVNTAGGKTNIVQFTNYTAVEGWTINQNSSSTFTNQGVAWATLSTNDVAQLIVNFAANQATLLRCGFDH